jgi:hypothetical protein
LRFGQPGQPHQLFVFKMVEVVDLVVDNVTKSQDDSRLVSRQVYDLGLSLDKV